MDINKAIKKQKKSNILFLLFLGFIFFALPIILFFVNRLNIFFVTYLLIIELLILITILINISNNYLKYSSDSYRLKIKLRPLQGEVNIVCDKVRLVHTEGTGAQITVILLTNSKFRNKKIKPVDENFLRTHSYLAEQYYKIKKKSPDEKFFYFIINKGGYEKYKFIDLIYRNCVKAQYTEEAVELIKEYRIKQ